MPLFSIKAVVVFAKIPNPCSLGTEAPGAASRAKKKKPLVQI